MISFFPKQIASKAIIVYLIALVSISILYFDFAMGLGYIALGVLWVLEFFLLTTIWSKKWQNVPSIQYIELLTLIAVLPRLMWVIASYFYYIDATGIPFEFSTADAWGYHNEAEWLAEQRWNVAWEYYFGPDSYGYSDVGYPLYLTVIYKLFGPIIIIPRIIKAFLSTITCILLYKLSARTFGESIGRMAGIMCALMPNFIIYCGYHLKETEMLFLVVAFLERLDYLIRSRHYGFFTILIPSLIAVSLFFFRTILGAACVFSFATTIVVSSTPTMHSSLKRLVLVGWGLLFLFVLSGGTIMTEMESYWEQRDVNQDNRRIEQTRRGNQWAQYATGTVMIPLATVLPFATMVDVDQQYEQQNKSGGNYVRNFMGFFAILAIYEAIKRKQWRSFAMIGSFVFAYLGVVSLSAFSNSERFLLPALPGLIMMWAYGISTLQKKTYKLLTPWCVLVFLMEIGWAYFKLGSRGLF